MADSGTPWTQTADEVLASFGVNPDVGLSDARVTELREQFGVNELTQEDGKPLWKLVLEQFDDLMVKILLIGPHAFFALKTV